MLPPPAPVVVVHVDYGGIVGDYAQRVLTYRGRKVRVRIEGECNSACTMVAALGDRVCVTADTRMGFHQAYRGNPFNPEDTSIRDDLATRFLMGFYPPKLQAWIASKGGLTKDMLVLAGEELRRLFRVCR